MAGGTVGAGDGARARMISKLAGKYPSIAAVAALSCLGKVDVIFDEALEFERDVYRFMAYVPSATEEEAAQAIRRYGKRALEYAARVGELPMPPSSDKERGRG